MAFAVVLDTCVLVPPTLCDTLLRLAEAGTYRPLWSEGILSELQGVMRRQGVADALIEKRLRDMGRAFPNSTIGPSSELVSAMTCDAKDRHVLAATVRSPAQTLVTFNGRDFPLDSTEPWGGS